MSQKETAHTVSYYLLLSTKESDLQKKFEWLYCAGAYLIGGLKELSDKYENPSWKEKINLMINDVNSILQEIEKIVSGSDLVAYEVILKATKGMDPKAIAEIRKVFRDFLHLKGKIIAIVIASGFNVFIPLLPRVYPEREDLEEE